MGDYDQLLSALVQRSNTCPSLDLDMCELSFLRATDYSTSGLPSQYTEAERLCDPNDLDNCNTQPSISAVSETDPHFGSQRSSYSDEACRGCSRTTSSAGGAVALDAAAAAAAAAALVFAVF